ncbi:hypothetical protein VKT23_016686 [Stygiomarasmius scandens]|uniref:Uncharacterized protein n=1 Tax=Marasmiellus scandens TaxID=2682957 RepID=A0ABR1IX62_9AGAR
MVRTRTQGPVPPMDNSDPPARRTRSKTTDNPKPPPNKSTKKRTAKPKAKTLYVEVPHVSTALELSASSAHPREQTAEDQHPEQLSPSESMTASPTRIQGPVRPPTPYASPRQTSPTTTSLPLREPNAVPINQEETLEMQSVTYQDLEREESELHQKSNIRPVTPVEEGDSEGAYDEHSEWGGCAPDSDSPRDILQSEVNFDKDSALRSSPPQVSSFDSPQFPNSQTSHPEYRDVDITLSRAAAHHNEAPLQTNSQSQTPQQRAVDALRLYTVSSMGVDEIADYLQSLLGKLSSEWYEAISYATVEPGDDVGVVQQALEDRVPSLLKWIPLHQRAVERVIVSPQQNSDDDDAEPVDDVDEEDDDGSSDWGAKREKEKELKRKKRERMRKIREKNGEVVDSETETDSEEETDEEDPPVLGKRLHIGTDGRRKGKKSSDSKNKTHRKSLNIPRHSADEADDEADDGADDGADNGSGRIPAAMKAEIWKIRAEYEAKMDAVTLRYNHSLQSAYRIAGELSIVSRDPNLFNLFEKWWVAEDGNNGKVPASINPGTFLSQKWQETRCEKLGDDWNAPDKVEEEFGFLRKWYSERYSKDPKMGRGPNRHDIKAVAKIVSDVAKQATLNRGVWVLGYVLDPNGRHSMVSGWGKPYESMKLEYPTQLASQLYDVGVLYGAENLKQMGVVADPELRDLVKSAGEVGSDRAHERAIVPKILLYDLVQLDISPPKKWPWKNFADHAWRWQIRIMNWPEDIAAPGSGLRDVTQAIQKTGGPGPLTAAQPWHPPINTNLGPYLWYRMHPKGGHSPEFPHIRNSLAGIPAITREFLDTVMVIFIPQYYTSLLLLPHCLTHYQR